MSDVNMMIVCLVKLLVLFSILICSSADRKVTTNFLQNEKTVIAHIQAKGSGDTLHYLVATIGIPTIFVALTDADARLQVDWDKLDNTTEMGQSIKFNTGKVHHTYSILFTRLIEYNDTNDKADMEKYTYESTAYNSYDLGKFSWQNMSSVSDVGANSVLLKALPDDEMIWERNGTFSIKINAFGGSGRESQLPHLEYREDIIMFDLNIDHLSTNLSMSRFAIEMIMVGDVKDQSKMKIDESHSIDDEYTPGVFSICNWQTKPGKADGAFLQWKPVCYQDMSRARSVATTMKHYDIIALDDHKKELLDSTIVYGYHGDALQSIMTTAANFSFGLSQDGGYNKTMVTTWSASVGSGTPPTDAVSTIVIIIISAGLGLPAVIIIFGGLFVCIKKRSSENKYKSINAQ